MRSFWTILLLFCTGILWLPDQFQDHASGQATDAVVLKECEARACDGVWTLYGSRGTAKWTSGPRSTLVVAAVSHNSVVINRSDYTGSSPGLTASYRGVIADNKISGTVTWKWDGAGWPNNEASGKWSATIVSGSLAYLSAAVPEEQTVNTISGPWVLPKPNFPVSAGGPGILSNAKASLIISQIGADYYIMVTNQYKSDLTDFSVAITMFLDGAQFRHYYDSKTVGHYTAKTGNSIIDHERGIVGRGRLLAAEFADGTTFGDPDEVSILRSKLPDLHH
jgi:hypothetical protein